MKVSNKRKGRMERMNLCRLEMAKAAKKTDKAKKPSQSEGGGRVED